MITPHVLPAPPDPSRRSIGERARPLRQLTRLELASSACALAALLACNSKDPQPLVGPLPTGKVIGREGGMIVSTSGGLRVEVPAGALAADTNIAVEEDPTSPLQNQLGPRYRVSLSGGPAKAPLTLTFEVPTARNQDVVTLLDVSGARPTPVLGARFDLSEQRLRVQLAAPTSYAVIVRPPRTSCDGADAAFPFEQGPIRPCWIDEEEPNDSLAAAQPTDLTLNSGVEIAATIDATDDYYSFVVPARSTGTIEAVVHSTLGNYGSCPPGLIVQGELLDDQGRVLSDGENERPCVGFNFRSDQGVRDLSPGRYTIRLTRGAGGQDQSYRLALYLLGPGNGLDVFGPDGGF